MSKGIHAKRNTKATTSSKQFEDFYQHPCWLDLWLESFNLNQLEFWSQLEGTDAARLLSHLERAGFLTMTHDASRIRLQVHSAYYSALKIYRLQAKPSVPGTPKASPVKHTQRFRYAMQRIWTSMRILQTFSVGQLQACSDVSNDMVRTVVFQLYQFGYIQLLSYYPHRCFLGNENLYQLTENTGARAPFLYGNKILYDANTNYIYQVVG